MKDYEEVKKIVFTMLEELDERLATITDDTQTEQSVAKNSPEPADRDREYRNRE